MPETNAWRDVLDEDRFAEAPTDRIACPDPSPELTYDGQTPISESRILSTAPRPPLRSRTPRPQALRTAVLAGLSVGVVAATLGLGAAMWIQGSLAPLPALSRVQVQGDALRVTLLADGRRFSTPGSVPPGRYRVEATFLDVGPITTGDVEIGTGPQTLACSRRMMLCAPAIAQSPEPKIE
jgi:hypothetical protein